MKTPILTCVSILIALTVVYAGTPDGKQPAGQLTSQPATTRSTTQSASLPITDEVFKNTPWGKEVNGLACRLLVNPKYCRGEPVSAVVEIKNVSKEQLTLYPIFHFNATHYAKMDVTGTDNKKIINCSPAMNYPDIGAPDSGPGPRSWSDAPVNRTIDPGETIQVCFSDLEPLFIPYGKRPPNPVSTLLPLLSALSKPGKYTLVYSYDVPRETKMVWTDRIESNVAAFEIVPPGKDDLKTHEWGVFSIYTDIRYANAGMKAEWESMPDFFYRQFPNTTTKLPLA